MCHQEELERDKPVITKGKKKKPISAAKPLMRESIRYWTMGLICAFVAGLSERDVEKARSHYGIIFIFF